MFRYAVTALFAELPGSFTCHCGNRFGTDTEINVSTESRVADEAYCSVVLALLQVAFLGKCDD